MTKKMCPAPWTTIDTIMDGSFAPCCHIDHKDRYYGKLKDYKESHYLNGIKRSLELGQLPDICHYCRKIEENDKESPRHDFQKTQTNSKDWSRLNLRISNICDLSCRTCNAFTSSSWYEDALKLGQKPPQKVISLNGSSILEEIFEQIETTETLYLSGGEPALDPNFKKILSHFLKNTNPDKNLNIQNNGNTLHLLKYRTELEDIKNLDISFSIDGLYERGEFIRNGLVFSDFEQNVHTIIDSLPQANISFVITLCLYNVLHVTEVIDYCLSQFSNRTIEISFNFLDTPLLLSPQILSYTKKTDILKHYNEYYLSLSQEQQQSVGNYFDRAAAELMKECDEDKIFDFVSYTKALDRIRNQSTFDVFPELRKLIKG